MTERAKFKLNTEQLAMMRGLPWRTLKKRILLYAPSIETRKDDAYAPQPVACYIPTPTEDVHLVTSVTVDGTHKPVLDIDYPCTLEESATPGKFHLYIEKELSPDQYRHLIEGLWKAGLLEEGYRKSYDRDGFTAVRLPGVKKMLATGQVTKPGFFMEDEGPRLEDLDKVLKEMEKTIE